MSEPGDAGLHALAARIGTGHEGVHHFPIRHHSPACARHLAAALLELRPATILLEMPVDFAPLLPALLDPLTVPPVAIVSIPPGPLASMSSNNGAPSTGYWPLSATSPELAAIRSAHAIGARLVPCDLPSAHKAMLAAATPEDAGRPRPIGDERQLAHSDWMRALVARTGSRDFNELWDRLFESRLAEPDWRAFFGAVAVYCACSRASTPPEHLTADTLPREAQMRAILASHAAETPVAVITGGFHTPALLSWQDPSAIAPPGEAHAYLVRFSHPRLDRLNGYGAGMPNPRWYERILAAAALPDPFTEAAQDVLLGLATRLRTERPALAPNVPALSAALQHAARLATLRGLPGPGRHEVLDAALSCFVQDEDPRFAAPILDELQADMTGWAIGNVPPGTGSPPLVEAARRAAKRLGFTLTDSIRRNRELDIHRNDRHREASRFLHALEMLGAPFARMERGPDWSIGANQGLLFEAWTYAWSPMVEAALIEAASDGDTVERACLTRLRRQIAAEPGRDAVAICRMLVQAGRAGLQDAIGELLPQAAMAIADDPDLPRVAAALGELFLLWRARAVLGLTGRPDMQAVLAACWRRACYLVPEVADTAAEHARDRVAALAAIRDVADAASDDTEETTLDRTLFDGAIDSLAGRTATMPPLLAGAVAALAVQAGRRTPDWLANTVASALSGPHEAADRVAPLHGVLLVAPELVRRVASLTKRIDTILGDMPEDGFIAMLPHLRRAFTALDPRETAALAKDVASAHGLGEYALHTAMPAGATEAELLANLAQAQALTALLEQDGLAHWIAA